MTTRRKAVLFGAVAVGVAAIVIANLKLSYEASVEVEVEGVGRGRIVEKVSGPGVVYASSSVKISSSVMGRITRLYVKEGGSVVKRGKLLEIDSSQYRARLEQAEAGYRAAAARAELARAKVEEAEGEAERAERLSRTGLISERDLDISRTGLAVARAELDAAEQAVSEAGASRAAALDDLSKTLIVSPIDGTVTSLNVEEGEIVITGTMNNPGTVIMAISNLDTMEVRADIDETDVGEVGVGQAVEVSVDAFGDTVLAGLVSAVGSSSGSARSMAARTDERPTFEVRVRIVDALPGLRPGMTATVDIVVGVRDSALHVPIQALVLREVGDGEREEEGVFAVRAQRAVFTPLATGISDEKNIEVIGGLGPEAEVATGPFKVLRDLEDGDKVKAKKKE